MKKIILSLAILVTTSMSIFAARAPQSPESKGAQVEQRDSKGKKHHGEGKKDDKGKKGDKKDRQKIHRGGANPFEGIDLSDEQKTKLKELQASLRPEPVKMTEEEKASLTDEQKKQMKEEQKAKRENFRKDYLAGVKEILTPDQYVKFLENSYLQSGNNFDPRAAGRKMVDPRNNRPVKGPQTPVQPAQ